MNINLFEIMNEVKKKVGKDSAAIQFYESRGVNYILLSTYYKETKLSSEFKVEEDMPKEYIDYLVKNSINELNALRKKVYSEDCPHCNSKGTVWFAGIGGGIKCHNKGCNYWFCY